MTHLYHYIFDSTLLTALWYLVGFVSCVSMTMIINTRFNNKYARSDEASYPLLTVSELLYALLMSFGGPMWTVLLLLTLIYPYIKNILRTPVIK